MNSNAASGFQPSSVKGEISLEILDKVDVRVGTITTVERLATSQKTVKLTVDFGDHERTIMAGLGRERDDPREVEGKQALFVVNLPPRKMMGEMSEGMLFDIGYDDGIISALAVPERAVPNGARLG